MTRDEWLLRLEVGSLVAIYIGSNHAGNEVITSANDKYVTIGKHGRAKRFNRKTGVLCGAKAMKHLFRIEQPT